MYPTLLRRSALPAALAAAVLVAGCASTEEVEFVDGYNAAVAPLTTTMSNLSTSLAGDPAAASKSLDRVADKLVDVRADLAALEPPEDASDEFDRLLVALDKAPKQVHAMAKATKSGNLERLAEATADLSTTATRLIAIEEELRTVVEG